VTSRFLSRLPPTWAVGNPGSVSIVAKGGLRAALPAF
jgi:hypothetical protein